MGHLRGKFTKGVRHIGRAQASLDPRLKSSAWPPILVSALEAFQCSCWFFVVKKFRVGSVLGEDEASQTDGR